MENENMIYELCPICEDEVQLKNEFKLQICPTCGKYIVPCSICQSLNENGKCSNDCGLSKLADILNKE